MLKKYPIIRKIFNSYLELKQSEKVIVGITTFVLLLYIVSIPITSLFEYIDTTNRLVAQRKIEAEQVRNAAFRYASLYGRLERLQEMFDRSQLTFEEATRELDSVVRESIASENFDLDDSRSTSQVGVEYERQSFVLRIRNAGLEQLVKLFYSLEHGKSPLFLGKADIQKAPRSDTFSATLEIYTIRKSNSEA